MDARELTGRFEGICSRMAAAAARSGRNVSDVQLVAVSKWHGADAVSSLARHWAERFAGDKAVGRPVFGESYVQEAVAKRAEVEALLPAAPVEWHFIGHLQSNKAREVAGNFALVHSVGSVKLGAALQKAWINKVDQTPLSSGQSPLPPQAVLVQINIGRETQKSGVFPEEAEALVAALAGMPELLVQGLMCLPPDMDEAEDVRPFFRKMRELRDALRKTTGLALPHLSMGMSHDFEQAIEEGATLVRVGTDIFGPRL
jgi:pyridoxal phosphate enzyme (YggS family)